MPPRLEAELREHMAVVLLAHHGFVARLPVVAGDDRVERFGRVARDAQLRRRTAGHGGELSRIAALVRHLPGAQVVRGLVVDLAHLRDERLEDRLRLHAVVAALEIDVVGLEAVLAADRQPRTLRLRRGDLRAYPHIWLADAARRRDSGPRRRRCGGIRVCSSARCPGGVELHNGGTVQFVGRGAERPTPRARRAERAVMFFRHRAL